MSENGDNGAVRDVPAAEQVQIIFQRKPYTVALAAPGVELIMTIAVLRTALDELEAQLRMTRVAAVQQAQADAALAARIMGNKGART